MSDYSDKLRIIYSIFMKYTRNEKWLPIGIICNSCLLMTRFNQVFIFIPGYRIAIIGIQDHIKCDIAPDPPSRDEIIKYIVKFADVVENELEKCLYIWSNSDEYADIVLNINKQPLNIMN